MAINLGKEAARAIANPMQIAVCPLPLQLHDFEEERISPSRQHEVKIEVHLSSFHVRILDLVYHQLEGRVGPEVVEHELDAPVLEVVAGADVLGGQGHVQLGQGQGLDMADQRLLELLLGYDDAVEGVVGLAGEDEGAEHGARLLS